MLTVRTAVLLSGGGTNLQALIDAQSRGEIAPAQIALALSNRKAAYGLLRARQSGIATSVVSKHTHPDPDDHDRAILELLALHQIDLVVLAGYLGIVGPRVLAAYRGRIVNIHPALIPSFCGMGYYGLRVHEAALERGVKITGATAHLVDAQVDGGPILLQKAVEVEPGDTAQSLQNRVMEQAEWVILPQAVQLIARQIAAAAPSRQLPGQRPDDQRQRC